MKAIGYARVSTTKQDLARQQVKIKEYCESKDHNLMQIIEDFGISGAKSERDGYKKVLSLTKKDCDVVIVSELSRLSRQEFVIETVYNIQNIINNGISVILLDNPGKIYKANELLKIDELIILTIQAYGAAQERFDIKKKNQDGKVALFLSNPYAVVDGLIPFGYKKIPNPNGNHPKYVLQENPDEADIVRKIFELVLNGNSLYSTCKYFNERNIKMRNYPCVVTLLSRLLKKDIYRGIRTRIQNFDKEEPIVHKQYIKPIISEDDFIRANELIQTNFKHISTGKVFFNPLKGIIRCRCGRAMTVKDKRPAKNVTKLTYRCSCNYDKRNSLYCTANIDEISYDLTNNIIAEFFKQRMREIQDYYNNTSDHRIEECKEIIAGLSEKVLFLSNEKKSIERQISDTVEKFLITTNKTILNHLDEYQNKLEANLKDNELQIEDANKEIAKQRSRIDDIKKINTSDVWSKILTISDEELSVIYHDYLDKIEYYPINHMKGFYKIQFKGGMQHIIAINKVRSTPKAYLIPDNWSVDLETGDITTIVDYHDFSEMNFSLIADRRVEVINIMDFFKSKFHIHTLEIGFNTDYRDKFQSQLDEKGYNGHRYTEKR